MPFTGSRRGVDVVESLSMGLNTIRDLMYQRIHHDVERHFGADSMCVPLSSDQSEYNAKAEIDIWQIVEAAEFVSEVSPISDLNWACGWLGQLRLGGSFNNGPITTRFKEFLSLDNGERRQHFAGCLEKVLPEARRCPLIIYQLIPHAVHIAVSVAFGETEKAGKERDRQVFLLPGIADCRSCHGNVLDNGEVCADCGNPLWGYKWLMSTD